MTEEQPRTWEDIRKQNERQEAMRQAMRPVRVSAPLVPADYTAAHLAPPLHEGPAPRLSSNEPVECGDGGCTCCGFCGHRPTEEQPVAQGPNASICRNCAAAVVDLYAAGDPPVTFTLQEIPPALVDQARAALSLYLGAGDGSVDLETTIRVIAREALTWGRP